MNIDLDRAHAQLDAIIERRAAEVEELAAETGVSAGRIRTLENGGYVTVLAVSSLQAFFARQPGIDIREEPS